jgi:HEAT repeat protein
MSALSALSFQQPTIRRSVPSPAYSDDAQRLLKKQTETFIALHQARPAPPPFDSLDPAVAAELSDKWKEPCEGAFEFLAGKYPTSLLQLIAEGRLDVADLTFAAEIAGRICRSEAVVRTLRPLLTHSSAVVREGAIYGLANHLDDSLRAEVRRMSGEDASVAVRTAAADAVDEG